MTRKTILKLPSILTLATFSSVVMADPGVALAGVPLEFILFAMTLLAVAIFHHHTFNVAVTGLAVITGYKLLVTGFKTGAGLVGFGLHLAHEWVTLVSECVVAGSLLTRHGARHLPPVS